jgi:pimeloyl-ACP methyl ester carboxylesterase
MPTLTINGVELYYEANGQGIPLVFCHEFAGDYRSWEQQVRFFARRYRVVTWNYRGYPPSSVPHDLSSYSEEQLVADLRALLTRLDLAPAHLVGLSMGGGVVLKLGIAYPELCRSLVVAGTGYGAGDSEQFAQMVESFAEAFRTEGRAAFERYARSPGRGQLAKKDPRGYQEFVELLTSHSPLGSALTFLGVQRRRKSVYEVESELSRLGLPTLIVVGDEDEPCIEPSVLMKRRIPNAGLLVLPKSGHAVNLEEPDQFNRALLDFLTAVEQGRWASTSQLRFEDA